MVQTSLGPWKFIGDMDSSSKWEFIMAQGLEANGDNLGKSLWSSILYLCVSVLIIINLIRQF